MQSSDWKERIGGLRFSDGQAKKMFVHLELDELNHNSVEIVIYVVGLQIATIDRNGDISISL